MATVVARAETYGDGYCVSRTVQSLEDNSQINGLTFRNAKFCFFAWSSTTVMEWTQGILSKSSKCTEKRHLQVEKVYSNASRTSFLR